jgi:hypothetical protein
MGCGRRRRSAYRWSPCSPHLDVGDDGHAGPKINIGGLIDRQLGNAARGRSHDDGTGEVGVSLFLGGICLFELTGLDLPLRLQHGDLLLCRHQIGLCGIKSGLVLAQVGGGLLRLLLRAGAALEQRLGARILLLRESERGLRFAHLLLCLIDAGLLGVELRIEIGNCGVRLVDLGVRLGERGAKVTIVDARERRAGFHGLVVVDRDLRDRAVDLRADRDRAGIDERVVCRLVVSRIELPDQRARRASEQHYGGDGGGQGVLADPGQPGGRRGTLLLVRQLGFSSAFGMPLSAACNGRGVALRRPACRCRRRSLQGWIDDILISL